MKKKVRILSLFLTALMVISLSACGSADNRVEDGAKQDNSVANEQSRNRTIMPDLHMQGRYLICHSISPYLLVRLSGGATGR